MTSTKQTNCPPLLIGLAIFLFLCLMTTACRHTEPFANFEEWVKTLDVGYPRPQGNLSNSKYGTTPKARKKARKQWNAVLNKSKRLVENFKIPQSRTILR